jgi:uncharacterized protein (TIGR02118 family)
MVTTINDARSTNEIHRRAALSLGLAAMAGVTASLVTQAEGAPGGIKIAVLYGEPKDPAQFEKYYAETHMPMVFAAVKRTELAKGIPGPGGSAPFYRITELWFDSAEQLQQIAATPEWKKIVEDVPNFASGGATVLISKIE